MNDILRPIRVAHVITKMAVGGAQESAIDTCANLDPERFEQVLFSGAEVDTEGSLLEDASLRGVDVRLVPSLVRAIRPVRDLSTVLGLARRLRAWEPDIVHTHSSKAGLVGRLAARLARVPTVVHSVHGWSFNDDMSSMHRRFIIAAERVAAWVTDALVVESSTDLPKGLSNRIGRAGKYALIRNGIDLSRFHAVVADRAAVRRSLGVPEMAWVIGSVGRLADQKDPLLMVDAFAKVAVDLPGAHFVWVGDGPLRSAAARRAQQLGIAGRFHLVGLRRDIPQVLAAFDTFALSSRWEGLPRTITEAMAAGVPVVATSVDGTAEVVVPGVNGLLVPPGDADQLAAALISLASDQDFAARMATAGRERAAWFSVTSMREDMTLLYERLASGEPVPRAKKPLKVVHVISGLEYGGAERQLEGLIRTHRSDVVHEVVSLTGRGPIGGALASDGTTVTAVHLERGLARGLIRLRRTLARSGADVVQTWLYHGDVVGGVIARSLGLPVIWNVRMTWMDKTATKRSTMTAARIGALLSRWVPRGIVFNSRQGLESHRAHGYSTSKAVVIENGIDLGRFRPSPLSRRRLRSELHLDSDAELVGMIARVDLQKAHGDLLQAMRTVFRARPRARLVLVGRGCAVGNEPISSRVAESGDAGRVHLLGPRDDVATVTAGLDVAVSASTHGESFSNAVVEGLACGVPVVATDVGANRDLLGTNGIVVPAGSPARLASAIIGVLEESTERRRARRTDGRMSLFGRDFATVTGNYLELYESVLQQ